MKRAFLSRSLCCSSRQGLAACTPKDRTIHSQVNISHQHNWEFFKCDTSIGIYWCKGDIGEYRYCRLKVLQSTTQEHPNSTLITSCPTRLLLKTTTRVYCLSTSDATWQNHIRHRETHDRWEGTGTTLCLAQRGAFHIEYCMYCTVHEMPDF